MFPECTEHGAVSRGPIMQTPGGTDVVLGVAEK